MGTVNSTPFALFSTATYSLTVGVPDVAFAPLALANLVNSLSVPIEATELSVIVAGSGASAAGTLIYKQEIDLRIGRWGITNGFCPIRALGPRRETVQTENGLAISPAGEAIADTRWIFPRPLIIAPQEAFTGFVRLSPNATATETSTITVNVLIRARRYDGPMPKSRIVPYASGAFYNAANFLPPTRTFGNPFRVPLNVTSINTCDMGGGPGGGANDSITIVGPGGLSNTVRRSVASIAHTRATFSQHLAIEESTVLMPDEFFQITKRNAAAPSTNLPIAVVMSGYREEA